MVRDNIINFINKYNLDSASSRGDTPVILIANNNNLAVQFKTEDMTVLGKIIAHNIELPDGKYGVYNTTTLLSLCKLMQNEFTLEVVTSGREEKPMKWSLTDSNYQADFLLANLDIIPTSQTVLQQPDYDVKFDVNSLFIDKFVKSLGALPSQMVAFRTKKGKLELVVNYAKSSTHQIVLNLDIEGPDELITPLVFHSSRLKDILSVNKDLVEGTISLSSQGMMELSFKSEEIISKYYMASIID